MYRLKDVADTYHLSVRQLKDQVRAKGISVIILGRQWFFTVEQFEHFCAVCTVTGSSGFGTDPLEKVRARVANRAAAKRRRRAG